MQICVVYPFWMCSLITVSAGLFRTERDATNWSSDKLKSLLLGVSVESDEGSCEVTEVSKLEGEASINNRKGKLIFFYEWNLKATWTGKYKTQAICWFCFGGTSVKYFMHKIVPTSANSGGDCLCCDHCWMNTEETDRKLT